MNSKKIAVFHNFMDNIGGAEMVTLHLARELNANIYTTNVDFEQIKKMGFEDIIPHIISIGKVPKIAPFRHQLSLWKFNILNLREQYDFYIISGDWAMSGAVHNHPNMWYVHSPLNEIWAFKEFVRSKVLTWWKRPLFDMWVFLNRILTRMYSKHVDMWICNSQNTQNRIKKYYNKDASIIFPPVDTGRHTPQKSENFWLSVNRITKHKRIELQMKAFAQLPDEKLIIVGSYERGAKQFEDYKRYIESIKPDNVEIISWADSKKLITLYNTCKGFITTAKDEDFGMTVVEAMASGKPVIAPDEGGYKESVCHKKTGILIHEINEFKLIEAIKKTSEDLDYDSNTYKHNCTQRSEMFDVINFVQKIKNLI